MKKETGFKVTGDGIDVAFIVLKIVDSREIKIRKTVPQIRSTRK